ncbi:hypothetical protein VKT23_015352 [Stygiomarasmius scandens]|uniref:Gag protein n=1 Tax=Marasmiellus scandens TaxID=2682957 RepID=A0ABR1IYB6_9AGAR
MTGFRPPSSKPGTPQPEDARSITSESTEFVTEPLRPLEDRLFVFKLPDDNHPLEYSTAVMPTLRPYYKIGDNEDIHERRKLAIQYAVNGLGMTAIANAPHPTRSQYKTKVLKDYFDTLDHLLSSLKLTYTKPGEERNNKAVYTVSSELYQEFSIALRDLLNSIQGSIRLKGRRVPDIPFWPEGSAGIDFFYANDIEIIALAYRISVEQFLLEIDSIHDFEKGDVRLDTARTKPRSPVREGAEPGSISAFLQQSRASMYSNNSHKPATSYVPLTRNSRMNDLMGNGKTRDRPPHLETRGASRGDPPSEPGSDPEDEGDDRRGRKRRPDNRGEDSQRNNELKSGYIFDQKLKHDTVPQWDGNTDNIMRWISKVNDLADHSPEVNRQLGSIVPRRLQGKAEVWYFSLPLSKRRKLEGSWDDLKQEIVGYYMNRTWVDRTKRRARDARYREPGHVRETPSDYYIRKSDLLTSVFQMEDSELILEIMDGAPRNWHTILTTRQYEDACELQSAIRYHEETLMELDRDLRAGSGSNGYSSYRPTARANLVGTRSDLPPPAFPRDDLTISKKTTPRDKGARPCRHCGSDMHWDNECKHSRRRTARTRLAETQLEDLQAQDEYDDLYLSTCGEEEDF